MKATEVIGAYGHGNARSTHRTTFEITKEKTLTRRGDCIIAVDATKGARDLSQEFREAVKMDGAKVIITLEVGEEKETVTARGTCRLLPMHPTDLVVRKSDYVCDRTIAIRANKAASDFSRKLVEKLKRPRQKVTITLTAETV